jgi:hypothetical protein
LSRFIDWIIWKVDVIAIQAVDLAGRLVPTVPGDFAARAASCDMECRAEVVAAIAVDHCE